MLARRLCKVLGIVIVMKLTHFSVRPVMQEMFTLNLSLWYQVCLGEMWFACAFSLVLELTRFTIQKERTG